MRPRIHKDVLLSTDPSGKNLLGTYSFLLLVWYGICLFALCEEEKYLNTTILVYNIYVHSL